MMERLPQEIVNNIFLHLRLRQKLECMLVCHYWADTVRTIQLFHSIDMFTTDPNFINIYQLLDRLSKESTQYAKVKYLTLENEQMGSVNGERFFKSFDNLHSICLKNTKIQFQRISVESTIKQRVRGHDKIANIVEIGCCTYSFYVLSSNVCDRLTSLTLLPGRTHQLDNNLFNCLSNAPNLLSLTLSNVSIKMETLELIHHSLKCLEVLDLRNMVFVATHDFKISAKITPSSNMRTFYLELTEELTKSQNVLFDYTKMKYVNLEHFGIVHSYNRIPIEGIYRIIGISLVPLLQHLGNRLKTLKSPLREETSYIMTTLQQYDCKLQSLALLNVEDKLIFNILYKTNQYKYIQNLVLGNIATFENNPTPFYNQLDKFTYLVKLELEFAFEMYYRGKANFSYLMDMCPDTLEALTIGHVFLEFDTTSKKQYGLKKLNLKNIEYGTGLDKFLSGNFKGLRYLGLENVLRYGGNFHLTNLHLTCLNIFMGTSPNQSVIVVSTLANRRRYKYCIPNAGYFGELDDLVEIYGDLVYSTTPKLTGIEKISPKNHIPITCGSVKNLILNNRVAF